MDLFLQDVKERITRLQDDRTKLFAELEFIDAEIERLRIAHEVYRSFQKAPIAEAPRGERQTLPEAIVAVLKDMGGFGRIPDIYSALLANGTLRAKNKRSAYNQVYGAMQRHVERFSQVGNGLWVLVDAVQVARLNDAITNATTGATAVLAANTTGATVNGLVNGVHSNAVVRPSPDTPETILAYSETHPPDS